MPSVPRSPKPPGTRMPSKPLQMRRRVLALEHLRIEPFGAHLHPVGDAAMGQRLGDRLVGVLQLGVLADDGDAHLAVGVVDAVGHVLPPVQIAAAARA
jgi:hypothetical protein